MTDNFRNIWGVSLSILAFSFAASTASAQTCSSQPTCEELGYTQTEQYCQSVSAANNILKCPFDMNKVFCIANGENNCEIGSILYEDKQCHASSNLTPIGIVFDTSKKLAIALDRSKLQYATEYLDFNTGFHDAEHECDGAYLNTNDNLDIDSASGKEITPAFISVAKCMGISVPALEYCNSYSTPGTTAGEWFLGNRRELRTLNTNRNKVDTTLTKLGYPKLSNTMLWTSSQQEGDSKEYAWYYLMNEDYDDTNDKQNSLITVPILFY